MARDLKSKVYEAVLKQTSFSSPLSFMHLSVDVPQFMYSVQELSCPSLSCMPLLCPILEMWSIHDNLGLPLGGFPVDLTSMNFLGSRSSPIQQKCPNHLNCIFLFNEMVPKFSLIYIFSNPVSHSEAS